MPDAEWGYDTDGRYKLKSTFTKPDAPVASAPVVTTPVGRVNRLHPLDGEPVAAQHVASVTPVKPVKPVTPMLPVVFGSPSKHPCPYCMKIYDQLRPHFCREGLARLGL